MFTPHARGSTKGVWNHLQSLKVYPACAGIDRSKISLILSLISLPRMRGDRPTLLESALELWRFTPHARGSTFGAAIGAGSLLVYPACAGIDRGRSWRPPVRRRLPRMRGDRPVVCVAKSLPDMFTPHARGSTPGRWRDGILCRVYPACAGIDPEDGYLSNTSKRLPRMRGDRPCHSSG